MQQSVHEVHSLNRSGKAFYCEKSHQCDRNDLASLEERLGTLLPDVLIDMIPFTSGEARGLVSVLTNLNIDIPVLAISSIDVYAVYASLFKTEDIAKCPCPILENSPLRGSLGPKGDAYDKLSVQAIYHEQLRQVRILRLPALYGRPDTTRISPYIDAMLRGDAEIILEKNQSEWKFSRCLHKNTAVAISLAATTEFSGTTVYNVAEIVAHTERQWIELMANHCGWSGNIIETDEKSSGINWKQHFYVCSQIIRSELHYAEEYSIEEGFADILCFHAYNRLGKIYKKYY